MDQDATKTGDLNNILETTQTLSTMIIKYKDKYYINEYGIDELQSLNNLVNSTQKAYGILNAIIKSGIKRKERSPIMNSNIKYKKTSHLNHDEIQQNIKSIWGPDIISSDDESYYNDLLLFSDSPKLDSRVYKHSRLFYYNSLPF